LQSILPGSAAILERIFDGDTRQRCAMIVRQPIRAKKPALSTINQTLPAPTATAFAFVFVFVFVFAFAFGCRRSDIKHGRQLIGLQIYHMVFSNI
jgi:hypothetical protein